MDISIQILRERVLTMEELKKYNLYELRTMLADEIHWMITTEWYDNEKMKNLRANENKVWKLIAMGLK